MDGGSGLGCGRWQVGRLDGFNEGGLVAALRFVSVISFLYH